MREFKRANIRRNGPKHPLPPYNVYTEGHDLYDLSEPPYYSIDNTEDIYGTNLLPSQRSYVDPWDLENYDYVRKKLGSTPSPSSYYEGSVSPDLTAESILPGTYCVANPQEAENEGIPAKYSIFRPQPSICFTPHFQCDLECCAPNEGEQFQTYKVKSPNCGFYGRRYILDAEDGKYENYMTNMMDRLKLDDREENPEIVEQNIYADFSSSSSVDPNSSVDDEHFQMLPYQTPRYVCTINRQGRVALCKPQPHINFPAPPPLPHNYESYGSLYATLPYCSVSDCYECIYGAGSTRSGYSGESISMYGGSTLERRRPSSTYDGIYANKFGMSKKGMLQIDYSCSWNDLGRVMGRNY